MNVKYQSSFVVDDLDQLALPPNALNHFILTGGEFSKSLDAVVVKIALEELPI